MMPDSNYSPEHISQKLTDAGITHEVKRRTIQQNKALYKWERMLADELNNSGLALGEVILKLPKYWTQENLHVLVIHPLLNAMYPGKVSTSDLSTTELQELYKVADQVISERTGVHVEFPSRFGDET
jgi:hypothetical protein